MEKLYIPVITNSKERWHIDISNLSLSQLIQLREELKIYSDSVSVIDGILKTDYLLNAGYEHPNYHTKRDCKKIRKKEKMRLKKKCKERKDR